MKNHVILFMNKFQSDRLMFLEFLQDKIVYDVAMLFTLIECCYILN